jgi:hypothetical protein
MAFFGTTPSVVAGYLETRIRELKPDVAFVPFAGNFVVEQLVANISKGIELHSTDVSLYSRGIGLGVTMQKLDAVLRPNIAEMFPIIAAKTDPLSVAVQIIFLAEASRNMGKEAIPYYSSLMDDAIKLQETYYQKIMQKIEIVHKLMGHMNFYGVDACQIIPKAEKGAFMFYDPPVLLGDYEKMFAPLESCYDYEPPGYTEMTKAVIVNHLQEFNDKEVVAYYRTNNPIEKDKVPAGYEEVYRHGYKHDAAYCIYSNAKGIKKHVGRFNALKEEVKHYPLIGDNDVITNKSKVEFLKVPGNVANHYRLMWVKKAQMSNGGVTYLIFVDGKMIGMAQLNSGLTFGTDLIPIFSDPACPHSRYKRLSKLIIGLICSKPVIDMVNEDVLWTHVGFTTKVFTNEPVSMKYRSMFELVKKEEIKDGHYKYSLIYQNRKKIHRTFKEALTAFLDKDGKYLQ